MAAFLLRLSFGLSMFLGHGYMKLMNYSSLSTQFPDPFGLGSSLSLALTVFAETLCALMIAFGLFTRLACIPLIIAMGTALFIIHASDPWQNKELAFVYLVVYVVILVAGPGRYGLGTKVTKSTSWIAQ